MTAVGKIFADYLSASRFEDLPQEVRQEGRRAFVNWMGCVLGGWDEAAVECALAAADEISGPRQASVIGRAIKLDVQQASFVNAISASVHAFDDTHYATVAHPTAPVGAALYALAESRPVEGADFLHALVLGIEVQCRIGNILTTAPAQCTVGLSMAGLVGGIGSAMAAGKLMGLSAGQLLNALGIAANQACGLREAHGSMSSHFTPGRAALGGMMSARLAAKGYECSDTMLEGPKGFAQSYASAPNFEAGLEGLGQSFETLKLAYKPYPTGFVVHPAIDVCLDLSRQPGFDVQQVERIDLTLNPLAVQLANRVHPADRREALVSLQHWAAVALAERAAGVEQGTESRIEQPLVRALRDKVRLVPSDAIGREGALAEVLFRDGKVLRAETRQGRGTAGRPLSDDDLSEKFLLQAVRALPASAAQQLLEQCWRIDQLPEVAALSRLLAPQAQPRA